MLHKSKSVAFASLLIAVAVGVLSIWYWRQGVVAKRAVVSSNIIEQGVAAGDFVAARSALQGLADPALRTAKEREVRVAELNQALSIRDTGLLRKAVGDDGASWIDPSLLESADLELAREAVQILDFKSSGEFIEKWKSKSVFPGQWTLLEADQLLARKLPDEALQLLKSAKLSGPEDALRHARLALLEAKEPWKAMATIDQGLAADPRNADLLSFRAQIEEAGGRTEDARLDYVAAVLSERKNPIYREILANFYLRTGDLSAAAETWRDAAEDTGLGIYALKSWFWSRVSGFKLSKALPPSRQAGWSEPIAVLAATADNVFWSDSLDAAFASRLQRPEIIWLRLLESIRNQDFVSAVNCLETGFPQDAERLWPGLALHLLVQMNAMAGKDPRLGLAGRDLPPVADDAHPFLLEFSKWADHFVSDEENQRFKAWLARPAALPATLFASGWSGAAILVGTSEKFVADPNLPGWFDYGYAKSLQIQGGKEPARKWLESLPVRTTAADLFLGELQLASGSVDPGLTLLRKVAAGDTPQSSRAAWTLALAELDRGNSAEARRITLAYPELADSVQGKEILARVALAEGSRAETTRIYQELGEQSADAMIFLSKEAFAAKDFAEARKWTARLARRFPEQPDFRSNLIKIGEAEKLATPR